MTDRESLPKPGEQEVGERTESAPERIAEHRERARQETMERGQQQRAGLCKRILTSELVSGGLDLVPFAGSGKMLVESVAGSTLTGKEISGTDRLIHTAVGVGMLALDFTGLGEAADAARIVGKSTLLIGGLGAKLAEKGFARGASIFTKTAEFMGKNPELVRGAEAFAEARIRDHLARYGTPPSSPTDGRI